MPDDLTSHPLNSEARTAGLSLYSNLQSIIENMPVGIIILDENFQIVYNNPRASQILLHKDDMRGRSIEELCKSDHTRNLLISYLKSSLKASLPFTLQSPFANDIHVRLTVLRSPKEYCLFVEDHSEILLLEQELQSFKTAIHAAGDAIFIFDSQGLIFFTNPAFERQVNLPQEQILGQKIQYFWNENDSSSLHENLWQCIQNAQPWSGEMTCLRSDHSPYSVEMSMTPILTEEKQVVGFICVQRDITERKKIEKKLMDYSDNLERMVAERTEELANLHDITQ
ncbi:MAG: PAS domain-containing protein, partial [Candidatus Hinthialibacter sp.]